MEPVTTGYLSGTDWTLETPKVYIILGAHRSGTSFIANALREQGVDFARAGWRTENGEFSILNRDIIQAAGGVWYDPPPEAALLAQGALFEERIKFTLNLMRERGSPLWGWKDPRQCLTIRSYLDFLPEDVYLITVFRRPELVGASLERKGQVGATAGTSMAREYARRTISAIKQFVGI